MRGYDEILMHLGIIEKPEENMDESKNHCKLLNAEEIAKKLHAFDNFLEAMAGESQNNHSYIATLHAFRMQFLDYYYHDKDYHNWESNSQ